MDIELGVTRACYCWYTSLNGRPRCSSSVSRSASGRPRTLRTPNRPGSPIGSAHPLPTTNRTVSAKPWCASHAVCLGHGPPHLMQDCLSSAGILPGLHFWHVPVSPALPCPASNYLRCAARRERSEGLSRTDRWTIVAGSVVDVRVLPGLAGLACEPVGTVLLPHAIRAALFVTTQRKSVRTIGFETARAVCAEDFARTRTRISCDANQCWCGHRQRKE